MYSDIGPEVTHPRVPQGTLWAEVWQWEAADPWEAPACVSGNELATVMASWDRELRNVYVASVTAATKLL